MVQIIELVDDLGSSGEQLSDAESVSTDSVEELLRTAVNNNREFDLEELTVDKVQDNTNSAVEKTSLSGFGQISVQNVEGKPVSGKFTYEVTGTSYEDSSVDTLEVMIELN